MTDEEIRSKLTDAGTLVNYCRNFNGSSDKSRFTWASMASKLTREVSDEFKRRIESAGGKVNNAT
jgi:hypothetical protein